VKGVFAILALFALLPPAPVARNPRVTLRLHGVNPFQAATALRRASGIPLRLADDEGAQPLASKADFRWNRSSFAEAMRQICRAFRLAPRWDGISGYGLAPGGAAPSRRFGLFEKAGVRVFVAGLSIQRFAMREFAVHAPDQLGGHMFVDLNVELDDQDPAMVSGVANLSLRDDAGTILDGRRQQRGPLFGPPDTFPDTWSTHLEFPPLDRRAKKLAWLEGDLLVYGTRRAREVEIPVPSDSGPVRRPVGDCLLVVSDVADGGAAPGPAGDRYFRARSWLFWPQTQR
jgi:hypothetical protein